METKPDTETDFERYLRLCHAMQSGVKFDQETNPPQPESLKHLRVGVNTALVANGVVVDFLIKKGLVTEGEYFKALADGMQREVDRYEKRLSDRLGKPVTCE